MYPHLLKTEAWIISVMSQIRSLINDHYLLSEEYAPEYESRCETLLQDLNLYQDSDTVNALDTELKMGQFDSINTPLLNKYIRRVAARFSELWATGDKFIYACNEVILEHSMFVESVAVCAEVDTEDLPFLPNVQPLHYERKYHNLYYNISDIRDFFNLVKYKDEFDKSLKIDDVLYSYDDSISRQDSYLDQYDDDSTNNHARPEPRFCWNLKDGQKQELAELVWALYKSERLIDNKTGKPGTQKEIEAYFETIFGHSIDVMNKISRLKDTHKAQDGRTFTGRLSELVDDYIFNRYKNPKK